MTYGHSHNTKMLYMRIPCKVGPLLLQHGMSSGCRWREGLQIQRIAANIFNKQSRTADKGWSSSLGVGCGANNPSL
jgi:hypothetical protein